MIDLGTHLIALFIGGSFLASQLAPGRPPPPVPVRWLFTAIALLVCGYSVFNLVTGSALLVPGPRWVEWLLRIAVLAVFAASIVLYVRNDARRLREKKTAQQPQ